MTPATKAYIYGVIGLGVLVLAASLAGSGPGDLRLLAIYTAVSVVASVLKLRLPGMDRTFSVGILVLLYGVIHFSLPVTLIAGCAAAAAQSVLNAKNGCRLIQVLFNIANVCISISASFVIARIWLAPGIDNYRPGLIAIVACVYFVINTVLVAGVLSLLQKQSLDTIWRESWVWSFPYYLIGITLIGLLPTPGETLSGEGWLILLPAIYLVHFFWGLSNWNASPEGDDPSSNQLPAMARVYLAGIVAIGAILLSMAGYDWQSENPARFLGYLAAAVFASGLKIRLPYTQETLSPAFVLLLAAIAQFSLAETIIMASLVGAIQVIWRPKHRPTRAQILFNPACLAFSAALSWLLCRRVLEPLLGQSVAGGLAVSALVLYGCNTIIVAAMVALATGRSLSTIWKLCSFWSVPYYLVGGAATGIMIATSRTAGWLPAMLVLPLMGLIYVSYRIQIGQAVGGSQAHG